MWLPGAWACPFVAGAFPWWASAWLLAGWVSAWPCSGWVSAWPLVVGSTDAVPGDQSAPVPSSSRVSPGAVVSRASSAEVAVEPVSLIADGLSDMPAG